ncbi:hypothetical protein [Olleya sp. HaHaR_3_96]|uniref:hypothetical protein n=1 Tax=Olleya sp. HaHaR_3_96 TaxID=2745560 RepID=UPI001C4F1551|nr:hypothetical protein [Olleya sp. HaHaR_3_96]QXP59018.1 hypothetical protein H0I26_13985 [Olleya sp. HaHaR_3_96]
MKDISKKIKPGIGVGELKFGMSKNDAKKILGEPDSSEKYSYTNTEKDFTENWYYSDLGLNISFDEEDNWKLGLITIESEIYVFENSIYIGQEKNEILNELISLKITDIEYEDMETIENPTHELYSSDTLGINFWFDYNKLSEIQISPLFIDNETIKWPE